MSTFPMWIPKRSMQEILSGEVDSFIESSDLDNSLSGKVKVGDYLEFNDKYIYQVIDTEDIRTESLEGEYLKFAKATE